MPVTPLQTANFPRHSVAADIWAGCATAVIFYIEYLGLGSLLGEALAPGMPQGAALGTMLVIVPVATCSLFSLLSHGATLSGPRTASLLVVTKLLCVLVATYPSLQGSKTVLLAVITATAALTLLCGRHKSVQIAIDKAPKWLTQGFIYATALGIVAGSAAAGRLMSCLQVDSLATLLVYLLPVLLGIAWKPALSCLIEKSKGPTRLTRTLTFLQPLSLLAAAAVSWLIYEQTSFATPNGPFCGRFGDMRMDWSLLYRRLFSVINPIDAPPISALMWAALCGVVVGAVLLLESLTAFAVNDELPAYSRLQPRMLGATAAGNLLAATVGGAPASFSMSRTAILRMLGGYGRWAVPIHGLALLAIVLLATPLLALVPKLTASVALTLVGVQMVGLDTATLWKRGYRPRAVAPRLLAVVMFWLVVVVSLAADSALVGFAVLTVVAGILFQFRQWFRRGLRQTTVS